MKQIEFVDDFGHENKVPKVKLAFDGNEIEVILEDGQRNTIAEVTDYGILRLWKLCPDFRKVFEVDEGNHIVVELE